MLWFRWKYWMASSENLCALFVTCAASFSDRRNGWGSFIGPSYSSCWKAAWVFSLIRFIWLMMEPTDLNYCPRRPPQPYLELYQHLFLSHLVESIAHTSIPSPSCLESALCCYGDNRNLNSFSSRCLCYLGSVYIEQASGDQHLDPAVGPKNRIRHCKKCETRIPSPPFILVPLLPRIYIEWASGDPRLDTTVRPKERIQHCKKREAETRIPSPPSS
jgi:hypothetical protein